MDSRKRWFKIPPYQSESWRSDDVAASVDQKNLAGYNFNRDSKSQPDARDQTRALMLLGRINYKIIKGGRVYIEAGGVVYKTLYGGYWRSVFTGVEHYLFKCEQVSGSIWAEDNLTNTELELPIVFSKDGWTANGHSLSFMLSD
jgi:hypothetical protein